MASHSNCAGMCCGLLKIRWYMAAIEVKLNRYDDEGYAKGDSE